MRFIITAAFLGYLSACSGSNFSSASAPKNKTEKTPAKPSPEPEVEEEQEAVEVQKTPEIVPEKKVVVEPEVVVNPCLLSAKGETRTTATIDGENCINNTVDAGGADFDDYHVTIAGDLLKDGWQFFSRKEQEIEVRYNLGSPGSTTQIVSMQVVDCSGKAAGKFDVSSGTGTTKLKARLGDRFNIVTTITTGCYGRRDVYDLITDKDKAFRLK